MDMNTNMDWDDIFDSFQTEPQMCIRTVNSEDSCEIEPEHLESDILTTEPKNPNKFPAIDIHTNRWNTEDCIKEFSELKINTYYQLVATKPYVAAYNRVGIKIYYSNSVDGKIYNFWVPLHIFWKRIVCNGTMSFEEFNQRCIGFYYYGGYSFKPVLYEIKWML